MSVTCAAESGPQDTPATQPRQGSARSGAPRSRPQRRQARPPPCISTDGKGSGSARGPSEGTWDTQARPRVRVPPGSSRHHGLSQHTQGGLGGAHVYLQSEVYERGCVGTSPELLGGGECSAAETVSRLLTPRPASAWPGEGLPLLQRRHGGDRRPRELSLSPGVSRVFSSRVLRRWPCTVAGWSPTVPPGLVLYQQAGRGRVDGSSVGPRGQAACTPPLHTSHRRSEQKQGLPDVRAALLCQQTGHRDHTPQKASRGKSEQFQTSLGFAKCQRSVHRSSKQNFQSGLSPWSRCS